MKSKPNTPITTADTLPKDWEAFCRKGKMPRKWQRASVLATGDPVKGLTGYYSGLPLNPGLAPEHVFYPSHDHLTGRDDHSRAVVETRLVNDMKSILNEDEFWRMVEHLYAVGLEKGKLPGNKARKLETKWLPRKKEF